MNNQQMTKHISDNQVPSQESVAELLPYLEIFYPKGKVIDHVKHQDQWTCPTYRDDVDQFFRLVGNKWITRHGIMEKGNDLFLNKEKIRNATWNDLKSLLTYCIRMNRFSDSAFDDAISQGIIQLVLLRMKALSRTQQAL